MHTLAALTAPMIGDYNVKDDEHPPWTIREFCEFFRINDRHFRRMRDAGQVKVIYISERQVRIPEVEVQRILKNGNSNTKRDKE